MKVVSSAVKCLIVLAIVALLFITELIPLAITAIGKVQLLGKNLFRLNRFFQAFQNSSRVVLFEVCLVWGGAIISYHYKQAKPV